MKTLLSYIIIFLMVPATEQEMKLNPSKTELIVYGTSSIHDWEIEAKNCTGVAEVIYENDELATIKELSFKVAVTDLESGKSPMDDNTVEALKGDKYPFITYELTEISPLTTKGPFKHFDTKGKLTIAGASRTVNMEVTTEANKETVVINGEIKLKMTDFKVDPPTAIFGTITTGDDITIKFKTNYTH